MDTAICISNKNRNNSSNTGRIDIRFLNGTTNTDKNGNTYYTVNDLDNKSEKWEQINTVTYMGDRQMEYLVHPAFGFDKELAGIWVAKYETGKTIDGQLLSIPNAMMYNNTHIVNGFVSIREMTDNNMYGLNANAHLIKPTEYGAVVYLEESIYNPQKDYAVKGLDEIKEYTSGYVDGTVNEYNDIYITDTEGNILDIKGSAYLETSNGTTTWNDEAIDMANALESSVAVKTGLYGLSFSTGEQNEEIGFRVVITE